jgi:hypothetical protein
VRFGRLPASRSKQGQAGGSLHIPLRILRAVEFQEAPVSSGWPPPVARLFLLEEFFHFFGCSENRRKELRLDSFSLMRPTRIARPQKTAHRSVGPFCKGGLTMPDGTRRRRLSPNLARRAYYARSRSFRFTGRFGLSTDKFRSVRNGIL